jgi:hypothetical protein
MSKRIILVAFVLLSLCACSAFDSDNTPYVGFSPDVVPLVPGGEIGIYSGYYAGTMTLDSNSCAGVSDEVGAAVDFAFTVVHNANIISVAFADDVSSSGEVDGTDSIIMIQTGTTKHVYYLDFSVEDAVGGSCEVIEAAEDGSYGEPCASYTIALEKTDKPSE